MSTTRVFTHRLSRIVVLLLAATLLTTVRAAAQDPGYYDECVSCQLETSGDTPLVAGYPIEPPAGSVDATQPGLPGEPTPPPPGGVDPNTVIGDQIQTDVVYLAIDSDFDSLLDGDEISVYGTNPYNRDTDGDGLTDAQEVLGYGTNATNPNAVDTDYDGLDDWSELNDHFTDPRSADTDGDGWSDGYEVSIGSNPTVWHLH